MPSIFHQLLHDSLDLATFDQNPVAQTFIKDSEVTTFFETGLSLMYFLQ